MGRFKALVCCTAMALLAMTGARAGVMNPIPGDPITIESGKLSGTLLDSGVKAYLGVPFAAPPLRELRWKEPQPVEPWSGLRHADRFAPECLQPLRGSLQNHYFVNGGFFEVEDQLLRDAHRIASIPGTIVHGRYDVVCPIANAWGLKRAWSGAELVITPTSGHSAFEPENVDALVRATDRYA